MKKILIISPHADDETLGCGGIISKLKSQKCKVYWLLITKVKLKNNSEFLRRNKIIIKVKKKYKFDDLFQLQYLSSKLNYQNLSNLTSGINKIINLKKIDTIFAPYSFDAHSDHFFVSKASIASSKIFRAKTIEKIFIYEVLSETNYNFDSKAKLFKPNIYFDISKFLKKKISIMKLYKSEIGKHPFPRSIESIKALALLRGSESNFKYAEAFQQIFSKIK